MLAPFHSPPIVFTAPSPFTTLAVQGTLRDARVIVTLFVIA